MQVISILKTGAAYWAILQVISSIDRKALDFEDFIIYFYVLLENIIVIKQNVNENATKAAETISIWDYAKSNDCIL